MRFPPSASEVSNKAFKVTLCFFNGDADLSHGDCTLDVHHVLTSSFFTSHLITRHAHACIMYMEEMAGLFIEEPPCMEMQL